MAFRPLPVHVAVNRWTTLATDAWTVAVKKEEGETETAAAAARRRSTFKLSPLHRMKNWPRFFSISTKIHSPCYYGGGEMEFFAMIIGTWLSLTIWPVRVGFLYPGQEHGGRTGWTGQTGQILYCRGGWIGIENFKMKKDVHFQILCQFFIVIFTCGVADRSISPQLCSFFLSFFCHLALNTSIAPWSLWLHHASCIRRQSH